MSLTDHLAELLDVPVRAITDLGSSHAWTLHRATLTDGTDVFVKASAEPTTVFAAEAAGLRWLAAGTVPGAPGERRGMRAGQADHNHRAPRTSQAGHDRPGKADHGRRSDPESVGRLPADGALSIQRGRADEQQQVAEDRPVRASKLLAEVLAADDRMIVLPWLNDVGATPATAEQFGRELAALHANSAEMFGAPWQGWIAELPLDNTPSAGPWGQWYAERRLAPYLPRAAPHLGDDGIHLLEQVIDRIDTLAGPPEPPTPIHGDLWSGNILWTPDRATLIDPAAHAGYRETDLAMLTLFGAPHLDRIRASYNETHPLAEGWRTRIPLHQLHHLLVHVVLFGPSYRSQTLTAASAALAS
ncbi:fructosamine kinase family protein [Nocardia sp. CA-128927]|uniref:fructosamine kinase family protein n=1 Tax=Nocardia sp. CA-128927 TaxID=3239975 RepID=UPI003D95415A